MTLKTAKTNREVHEEAAGMGLCEEFFAISGIDPDAAYVATGGHADDCDCWNDTVEHSKECRNCTCDFGKDAKWRRALDRPDGKEEGNG